MTTPPTRGNADHHAITPDMRTHRPSRPPTLARVIVAVLTLVLFQPIALAQRSPRVVLTSDRVDAAPGRRLLIPVVSELGASPPSRVRARLDDGRELVAELVRIEAVTPPELHRSARGWLEPPRTWSARAPADPGIDPRVPGVWFVLLHPPEDCVGQGLWIEGRRVDLAWLPDPYDLRLPGDALEADAPWASPSPPAWRDDAGFRALIEPDRLSPARRWRWKLAVGELAPDAPLGGLGAEPPIDSPDQLERALRGQPLAQRALDAFSEQLEARWQVALALLHRADAETARRVRARLAGAADLSPGPIVPVFAPLGALTDRLLDDLLDPRSDDTRRVDIARAWLDEQARGVAWVIDDAGLVDAMTGLARPTLGVVSLPDDDRPVALRMGGGARRATIEAVPPRTAVAVRPDADPDRTGALVGVDLELGAWSARLGAAPGALPATPPGLTIGPLRREWTMDAWLLGDLERDAPVPPDSACVALLHRAPETPGGAGWRLYVECMVPEAPPSDRDTVRVWLGPFGSPTHVLSVSSDGRVTQDGADIAWTEIGRDADRWVFDLALPDDAIGDDGVLRLSIERVDPFGRRTSAPRRMMPWQREPGRLAIDTSAWDGLGAP